MKLIFTVALLTLSVLSGPVLAETEPAEGSDIPFHLPMPEGWMTETIPFPLNFAPSIDYDGFEELRFAPGMFKADQEDFWAYAFVWWVPAATEISAETLVRDLDAYYSGLAADVAVGKVEPEEVTATSTTVKRVSEEGGTLKFEGTIETFDAFRSLQAITLNAQVEVIPCADEDRLAVFFALSPQPAGHEIWTSLNAIRKGFRCAP